MHAFSYIAGINILMNTLHILTKCTRLCIVGRYLSTRYNFVFQCFKRQSNKQDNIIDVVGVKSNQLDTTLCTRNEQMYIYLPPVYQGSRSL